MATQRRPPLDAITIRISEPLKKMLEELTRTGMHGTTVSDVVRQLAERGIRDEAERGVVRFTSPTYDRIKAVVGRSERRPKQAASIRANRASVIKHKTEVLRYSRVIIAALQDALDYDPTRHHNQPPPDLRLEDPAYLEELKRLVDELHRLVDILERSKPPARAAKQAASTVGKHFDKFFQSYAGAMGKVAAGLTGGAVIGLLYHAGLGKELIDSMWGHLKLPK